MSKFVESFWLVSWDFNLRTSPGLQNKKNDPTPFYAQAGYPVYGPGAVRVHIRSTYYTRINRGRIMYQRARNESQRIYLSSVTERQSTLAEPDLQNSGPVRYNVGAALVLLLISQNFPLFSDACLHGRPSLQSITLWNLMRFVAFWIGSLVFK